MARENAACGVCGGMEKVRADVGFCHSRETRAANAANARNGADGLWRTFASTQIDARLKTFSDSGRCLANGMHSRCAQNLCLPGTTILKFVVLISIFPTKSAALVDD